jgi:hypothetical protein
MGGGEFGSLGDSLAADHFGAVFFLGQSVVVP